MSNTVNSIDLMIFVRGDVSSHIVITTTYTVKNSCAHGVSIIFVCQVYMYHTLQ